MRRDEHGRAVFGDIGQHEIPDLTAHDGVESVDRLVEHEHIRPQAHRQPERGLLLHTLGQAADLPLRIELKHLAELLIAFGVEFRVDAAVVAHHVRNRRLREIEHVVRDVGDARLDGRVFVHGLTVDVDRAAVRAVDARQVADERGFARAVRPDEAVHRAARHGHGHAVERAETVKRLDNVSDFNHVFVPPSGMRRRSSSLRMPRYSSSCTAASNCCSSASCRAGSSGIWAQT